MSIPLPEPDDGYWETYSAAQMDAHALAAVEAYKASQVPMTEVQLAGPIMALLLNSGSLGPAIRTLIRTVEAHHNIGAKP